MTSVVIYNTTHAPLSFRTTDRCFTQRSEARELEEAGFTDWSAASGVSTSMELFIGALILGLRPRLVVRFRASLHP